MENPIHMLPAEAQDPIARFDYYSNRLKLDYLIACFTRKFNQDVLAELKDYYGQDVRLVGGMNEAFRWFLGNPDVEAVEALPTNEPFIEKLAKRRGSNLLFTNHDPRSTETWHTLEAACRDIIKAYEKVNSLEARVMIMAEFLAVKVTCHDIFIHGRSDLPSPHLFQMPFVVIDPTQEVDYIKQVLDRPLDDFKLKNILSYGMASGIDPAGCLAGTWFSKHRDRSTFAGLVKQVLERSDEVDAHSFFDWDIYGICNFVEGPVSLRKSTTRRCVTSMAQAWEDYEWEPGKTCTQASDHIAREAFTILFDHSEILKSGSLDYFSNKEIGEKMVKTIWECERRLDELYAQSCC